MKNYSCVIIDDEPKAIELLSESIQELYNNINIVSTFTRWQDALDTLRSNNFDILFLDISMPQKSGLDILALVPELNCEIIFVTAHSEFALDAFNVGAMGYIVKPVKDVMLTKVVNKALELIDNRKIAKTNKPDRPESIINKIGIPNHKGIDYIAVDNILFIEALKRYTRIVENGKEVLSSYNIGKYKQLVNNNLFYQVHRSYIVNLNYVVRYETTGIITMSNGQTIPVSKSVREDFLKLFENARK